MSSVAVSSIPDRHGWGTWLASLGIILAAFNLRTAITSLPPLYDRIAQSFPFSLKAQAVVAALPLLCFALFGVLAAPLTRRVGLERSLAAAMVMVGLGELMRAYLSRSGALFGFFSILSLGGMGMASVLLPPSIGHYFPRRIGAMTRLTVVLTAAGVSLPAVLAVPVSDVLGWRLSVGMWGLLGLAAVLPWLKLAQHHDPTEYSPGVWTYTAWEWPTSWAIALVFGTGALAFFALLAWLPRMLRETAGMSSATAGTMLAVYGALAVLSGLLVPLILARAKRPYGLIALSALCLGSGALGLGYAPRSAWFWIVPAALGPMFIPIGLALVSLRSRTEEGATALNGFVQVAGCLIAALGTLLVGYLRTATGDWRAACWFLALSGAAAAMAGWVAMRQAVIEDAKPLRQPARARQRDVR